MAVPKSVLVTGASRGIGLGFIRRFLQLEPPPVHIFATYRSADSAQDLLEIAKQNNSVHLIQLDVCEHDKFETVRKEMELILQGQGLNLLVNNAGIIAGSKIGDVTAEEMKKCFEVNTVSPIMMTQAMLPLLRTAASQSSDPELSCAKAAVINVSSKVGSCDDNKSGGMYSYRASKAALNVATVSLSVDLKADGILASVVHPGYVVTDMTGQTGLITVEESVRGLVEVMLGLNEQNCRLFHDYKHCVIPW